MTSGAREGEKKNRSYRAYKSYRTYRRIEEGGGTGRVVYTFAPLGLEEGGGGSCSGGWRPRWGLSKTDGGYFVGNQVPILRL